MKIKLISASLFLSLNFNQSLCQTIETVSGDSFEMNSYRSNGNKDHFVSNINFLPSYIAQEFITITKDNFYYLRFEKNNEKIFFMIHDENKKMIEDIEITKLSSISNSNYKNFVLVNNQIHFFYSGKSDQISKENVGFFVHTYDISSNEFLSPRLFCKFKKMSGGKELFIQKSKNGNFFSLIYNPQVGASNCEFSLKTFNKELSLVNEKILYKKKFSGVDYFIRSYLTNSGDSYLFFQSGKESTGYDDLTEVLFVIKISNDGIESDYRIGDGENQLSQFYMEENGNILDLYITFFNSSKPENINLQKLNLNDYKLTPIYSFNNTISEPFVNRGINGALQDTSETKTEKDVYKFRIATIFNKNESSYIIIEKRYNYIGVMGKYNATCRGYQGNFPKWEMHKTKAVGDLFLIEVKKDGETKLIKLLDRTVYRPLFERNIAKKIIGNNICYLYTDLISNFSSTKKKSVGRSLGSNKESDFALFMKIYNITTNEIVTKQISANTSAEFYRSNGYIFNKQSFGNVPNGFVLFARGGDNGKLMTITISN